MQLVDPNESPEEKKARIDEILRINSTPPAICIACKELITHNQTLVSTNHGPYHGWPLKCVEEGDPNYDENEQPH